MNAHLASWLIDLRQHPLFPELLRLVETPRITPFRKSEAEKSETARARFVFESGQIANHEAWIAKLTGEAPKQENS